jgi:hypothetical protein
MRKTLFLASALAAACASTPALAAPDQAQWGGPIPFVDGLTFDPIVDFRIRYENVDQPRLDADAVTARLRAGFEIAHPDSGLSLLAEGEGTLGIDNDYNAFPFAVASRQRRPRYAVIPDPENVELNRLQVQWKTKASTLTVGRQRINLDDQRWVGSVGWRQNEQTFDAARGEGRIGPVTLDATYALSQRTIFGVDAGHRQAYDGDFVFLNAGVKLGPVQVKGFSYLLDYDEPFFLTNSSQTYGVRAMTTLPLGPVKLNLVGSYARQSDYKANPFHYAADYANVEASTTLAGFGLTGGWELLGSDRGRALQTPAATLHKFNGWADVFLVTPNAGLQDAYVSLGRKFDGIKAVPGLNALVTFHQFDSDAGNVEYGTEWDASLGFKLGRASLLAKYADYDAKGFGVNTRKVWLQAEVSY